MIYFIKSKKISFMNEEFIANNIENDDSNLNSEESDYANLITKIQDISRTIALLEKTIS